MTPGAAGKGGRSRSKGEQPAEAGSGGERRSAKGGSKTRSNPLGRLRTGEAIYLAAAILLFVLMFFDWYGVTWKGNTEGIVTAVAGGDAWQTLEVLPPFLMLTIAVTVGAALLRVSGSDWKPAIPPAAAVCVLGILASVLILIRMISPPGPLGALSELAFESTLKLPVFLALAAALGIAYGGWRAMDEEGSSFAAIGKNLEAPKRPDRPKAAAKPKPAGRSKS